MCQSNTIKFYFIMFIKWSVLLTQYCVGDNIEKNEMGWACGAYGWGEGSVEGLAGETRGKETIGET